MRGHRQGHLHGWRVTGVSRTSKGQYTPNLTRNTDVETNYLTHMGQVTLGTVVHAPGAAASSL